MKINHNMSAVVANNQLLRNEDGLTRSLERLSSGLRINKAADDAAGMAISTKMKAQIKGLDQASRNASDGISLLDTADGALGEVSNMLQRMRELSVQAANGTNTQDDLKAIQAEIASLTEEVDRVAKDTEFNTKSLLDGTLDQRVYVDNNGIGRVQVSDTVSVKNYEVVIAVDARQAVLAGGAVSGGTIPEGTVSINGVEVKIEAGEDVNAVFEKLRNAAEYADVTLFANDVSDTARSDGSFANTAGYEPTTFASGTRLMFVSNSYGTSAEMEVKCDNPALASFLGIAENRTVFGQDVQVSLTNTGNNPPTNDFGETATVSCDGKYVTITDLGGFKLTFEAATGISNTTYIDPQFSNTDSSSQRTTSMSMAVNFDVTDIGTLTLQIGANHNQTVDVRIPSVSAENLYIDTVNVSVIGGADKAINTYDKAISYISESRSRIGAYQNRLDYTVASLDATGENITAALSRIEDVDMAKEMSEYTKYNVLTQAATSVLAQANDIPQQTLQLLQ